MAVNNNFAAQVDAWVREADQRMEAVFKESTQRVASLANSRIPVDLGFARASIQASTESMPSIDPGKHNKDRKPAGANFGSITLTISGARLGQTIYIGWTAAYVLPLEYGHSKQAPAGFVRIAAAQWPRIVDEVTAELKGRASAQ